MTKPTDIMGGALLAAGAVLAGREVLGRLREEDLAGQVAVITGGSKGLGFLLARELATEGCQVVICGRDQEDLARAQLTLEERGARVHAVPCDVSDRGQVERMLDEVRRLHGQVDILVNNAGIIQVGPVESMTLREFEQAQAVMFWGTVYPTLSVLPEMLARRSGRIVNITSVGGKVSVPHLLPYNCAKFAAVGFSEGLAAEVSSKGVRVTTIAPGPMRVGSYPNIAVAGNQEREYAWFSLAASLPLLSLAGERAARQVVRATKRGERVRILSTQANLLARFHGLFPGTTVRLLGVVDRLLPGSDGPAGEVAPARAIESRLETPLWRAATFLGRRASRKYQQHER